MEGFHPRVEAALEQNMSGAELMDCAYPNKRRWSTQRWWSVSAACVCRTTPWQLQLASDQWI
jgi:hypothetical protein